MRSTLRIEIAFFFMIALVAGVSAFARQPVTDHRPAEVVFSTPRGQAIVVAEVARTRPARERGLMFRRSLAADHGMLFIFPHPGVKVFWMKNTLIPLDMIFIDGDAAAPRQHPLSVVGVVADCRPKTRTPRSVPKSSRYVLEVGAGWATRHGVRAGTRVRIAHLR